MASSNCANVKISFTSFFFFFIHNNFRNEIRAIVYEIIAIFNMVIIIIFNALTIKIDVYSN